MAPLALVANLVTRWHHLYWIALLALSVSIEFVSSSARVTSVKFQQGVSLTELETTRPIDQTPGTPGSDEKQAWCSFGCEWAWKVFIE